MREGRIDWKNPEQLRVYKRDKMRVYRMSQPKNFRITKKPATLHSSILGVRIYMAAYRRTLEKVLQEPSQ